MSLRRIVFILTQDCQLSCKYCYLVGKNNSGKMTWDTAKKIVDYLMSLPACEESLVVDFIGGEPLLEIDLISQISDYIVEELKRLNHRWLNDFTFRLTTNGLLYSTHKVQEYINKYKSYLKIQISIDGTKRKHDLNRVFKNNEGSYEKIIPNVRLWITQFKSSAQAFMVVSHEDLPYLYESVVHHIEIGIRDIVISLVVEDVWKEGDGLILERELIKVADYIFSKGIEDYIHISSFDSLIGDKEKDNLIHPCGIPMYVFDYSGQIYSCIRFSQFSLRNKKTRTIGNLKTGIDFNKLRPLMCFYRDVAYPKECLECEIGSCCRWCPAENYDASESGTIFQRTTTVCELHKATVRAKNYYWNKR